MDVFHDGTRLPTDEEQDNFRPIASWPLHIQARLTAFRIGEAMKRLLTFDKPDESELSWLIETCDDVLRLALKHAEECERLWTSKKIEKETDEIPY